MIVVVHLTGVVGPAGHDQAHPSQRRHQLRHERHGDAVQRMNERHAEELLTIARVLGGHADATAARVQAADRRGIDLRIDTPAGPTAARIEFAEPIPLAEFPGGLRVAFVRLARRARTAAS